MSAARSPAPSGRRRGRKKGPPTPLPHELHPLPPGTEVEVRIDDDGYYGSWYEATVVGFDPGAGRRIPAQYTVTYSHLNSVDGPISVAASHVRPRPPPPSPPPRFLLHDIVEVFDCRGWWSGIVVAPEPDPADPDSRVTVAFPITAEVLPFSPDLVRPRRDYAGGEWVPSRAVVSIQPRRGARVYKAGEKIELLMEREVYGCSWFRATVAKVVDRLSYIVEYPNDQAGGGKVEVYRHWGCIRPAEYHRPRESKVLLCPGAAVEVFCDGAWSQGMVRKVVREGCEYEVSVDGEAAEQLLTKLVYQLRPLYIWNGKHWTIPSDKRQANLRQQSASRKRPSSPVDAIPSDDEHNSDPESSAAKKSREEPQQQEILLDECSEHASFSQTDASQCVQRKSLASDHCLNSCLMLSEKSGLLCASSGHPAPPKASDHSPNLCPPLTEKNGLSVLPHKIVSTSSVSKNGLLSASTGHTTPAVSSNHSLGSCSLLSGKSDLSMLAHKIVNTCSMSKNGHLCASSGNSTPLDESVPIAVGKTEFSRDVLSEMVPSNGQINRTQINMPVCARNVDEPCDMLSIQEVRKHNISSSLRNQETQGRPLLVKVLSVKKGISKNKRGETQPKPHQMKKDPSGHVQIQLKESMNSSGKETICDSSASQECQKTSSWTQQVSGGTSSNSDTEGVNFKKLARKEGTGLLDKELAVTIDRVCQADKNADVCTDTAATQVIESNPLTEIPSLSLDHQVQQDGSKVDERSILQPSQNAGRTKLTTGSIKSCSFPRSSLPSDMAFRQISGYQVPFVKSSPAWSIIDAMDVFKKVPPQQPHFRPLEECSPALREETAVGLMVTFASSVNDVGKSSIADNIASFEEKFATLRRLEENGFDVQFLHCSLTKLLEIKRDHISHLTEKDKLKAQLLERITSLSQLDEQLEEREQTIANLEKELGCARWEAQKIAEEREREEEELSRLDAADSRTEEACADAELQFQSILAELRRKSIS
ncbi:unnamed protein product [Urochloa humidicola]